MAFLYRSLLLSSFMVLALTTAPGQAQTTATLTVTATVVEECVISAALKRRIARLARKTGRTDIIQTCSNGVVSRTDERIVNRTILLPSPTPAPRVDRTRIAKARSSGMGESDVVLVTVTY